MEYFFYKGIDSRTVKGVIVTELPPITKPKLRVQTTTIDGRDGSIVTPLGYEAYTKTLKIGLTRGFDVDNIIAWLSGSGTLQMSNEIDKYYNAQVIEQIDYDKLLRFKTATVKFLVQPFKYSSIERMKTFTTTGQSSVEIRNAGNVVAKPLITLYGTGVINVSLNGLQKFTLNFGSDTAITLDSVEQEAYNGNILKNRQMDGDFLELAVGKNTITWTGYVDKIEITHFSRWL